MFNGNITLSKNKINDYTVYYDLYDDIDNYNYIGQASEYFSETDIAFSPNIVSSFVLSFIPIKKINIALTGKYVGKQYYDNTSNAQKQLDDYFTTNVVFTYNHKIKRIGELDFQFLVNNLLDKKYVANAWVATDKFSDGNEIIYRGFYPQAPRNFMTKITFRF